MLQARKWHVEYSAAAIVALKHERPWPHKENFDVDDVVERLVLPRDCTRLTGSQFSILSVADGDLKIRCATKSHFISCMTSSWSVYREGSDRRRCNIRLQRITHSGIVTAERKVASVGDMLCVGSHFKQTMQI